MNALRESRSLVLWLLLLPCQCGSAIGSQGFLIRGVLKCTESGLASCVPGSTVGFFVACRDDCVISGQHYKGEDIYSLAMAGNSRVFVIETDLVSGDPLVNSNVRRYKSVIEVREPIEDTFQSRLDAAEKSSFSHFSLPVFLSSRPWGIQPGQIEQAMRDGATDLSTSAGRLSITGTNEISRLDFFQSADDRFDVRADMSVKNWRYPPFKSGLREVRHTYGLSPPRRLNVFAPFHCDARSTFDDGEKTTVVAFQIEVEQYEGIKAAGRYIDAFLERLPAGIPVVSRSEISTVLDRGVQKTAVDYESIKAAREARFFKGSPSIGWLSSFALVGIIAAFAVFLWRRNR
jgi:hypothetical protein